MLPVIPKAVCHKGKGTLLVTYTLCTVKFSCFHAARQDNQSRLHHLLLNCVP